MDGVKRIELWLADASNEFQQLMKIDVEAVCRKAALGLSVHFTGYGLQDQVRGIRTVLAESPAGSAFVVLATRDRGLGASASQAARSGVPWFFLNEVEDDLGAIRSDYPGAAIAVVTADERETGRIQGRQFQALVPNGTLVLYVQGSTQSRVARERTAGVLEATAGASFEVVLLEAGWDPAAAAESIRRWLATVTLGAFHVDLVGCQNDPLALAAVAALRDIGKSRGLPQLGITPVTGCDGTPNMGQRLVREGAIRATVALPPWAGLAAQQAADCLLKGKVPPPLTLVKPRSFPPESDLRPLAS